MTPLPSPPPQAERKKLKKRRVRLPRVVYAGGLTAREHAIIQAHRWQVAHGAENMPTPSEAFTVIVDLLGLLPYEEVRAAIAKGTRHD